jgi:hypothetical protein
MGILYRYFSFYDIDTDVQVVYHDGMREMRGTGSLEEMTMRKAYFKPECRCQTVQLGVFGNYGGGVDDDGTGTVDPRPVRVIDGFRLHMD